MRVAARSTPIRWDDVANCESSGRWDLNTGNGFYGGLQFTIGTWRSYGGSGMPNEHTREEQIDVAERAAAGDGIMHTWPICGRFA